MRSRELWQFRMNSFVGVICLCLIILSKFGFCIYLPQQSTFRPEEVVAVNSRCPYDCSCSYETSYALCQNGFSLSMVKDKTFMYSLKTLSIKRVEEVLLYVHFSKFTKLENLDLSSNVITTVPKHSFIQNKNLEILKMTNNYIDLLSPDTFTGLENLRRLDLSHNNLHTLDQKLFDSLESLHYLNISMNAIRNLPLGAFGKLKNLQVLDLSSNNLVHVTQAMLAGLDSIKFVNMSRNYLATISNTVLQMSDRFQQLIISKNNFFCSCELEPLINRIKQNPTKYGNPDHLICNGLYKLIKMVNLTMPCELPEIHLISNSSIVLARQSVLLECKSFGQPTAVNYWQTPWGTDFSHENVKNVLQSYNITAVSSASYTGYSLGLRSKVKVKDDGSLFIDTLRGYFAGTFTCVSLNGVGTSNATVEVGISDAIAQTVHFSLYISAACTFLALLIGIIIGSISLCVQKCSCCCACCSCCNCAAELESKEDDFKFTIEIYDEEEPAKRSTLDSCNSNDSYPSEETPDTPFKSPIEQTPRASPCKCPTPNVENDKSKSPHIKDTLDEVKVRLEKKMEKVRGHYNSIKESGSVYFSNIKENAAGKVQNVRAGVVSGMEQVKYGVKSIKEFCGTGDMGTQTISAMSFTPDAVLSVCTDDLQTTTSV